MTNESSSDHGLWTVVDLGDLHFQETNHRYGIESASQPTRQIAKIEGSGPASLERAVLAAAAPLMAAAIRDALGYFRDPYRTQDDAEAVMRTLERAEAAAKGSAP